MLDVSRNNKVCSICAQVFSAWGYHRRLCSFCYRPVCSRCLTQTAFHPKLKLKKKICDACYSDLIKETVIARNKAEIERLKLEMLTLEKKYEIERHNCEKEAIFIRDLQKIIEETAEEAYIREQETRIEIENLEQDIIRINADYQDAAAKLEFLISQNSDFDIKIISFTDQIQDFLNFSQEQTFQKIQELQDDIAALNEKLGCKNSFNTWNDMKIYQLKDDIVNLFSQKTDLLNKISEMKQIESAKESNISMLITTLSNKSTNPDINSCCNHFEDEEKIKIQEKKISELHRKISKKQRKYEIETGKCRCNLY
jgi:hypothetical protein